MGVIINREKQLLALLKEKGELTIDEITQKFDISAATARRHCAMLAKEDKVLRLQGSIRHKPEFYDKYLYDVSQLKYQQEKQRIAQYTSSLIEDGFTIFLEAGTTIEQLAISIAERFQSGELSNLNVFSNSLTNLKILSGVCRIHLIGGLYRPKRQDFTGYLAEKMLRSLYFDYCFLGADSVNLTDGIMASDIDTVRFDELLILHSKTSFIMVNSAKFNERSLLSYASVKDVSAIITDNGLCEKYVKEFEEANIKLVIV